MEAADGDGVFIADLAAESARLGEANVMRLARRAATDDAWLRGDVLAVLLVAQADGLGRNATVVRAGGPGQKNWVSGGVINRGGERFFDRRIGFSASPDCDSSGRSADVELIVASLSRKRASTRSASAAISLFFAARFLWTQSAASSADWNWPRSASNRSLSAADCSGSRRLRAGRASSSVQRRSAEAPGFLFSATAAGRNRAATPSFSAAPALLARPLSRLRRDPARRDRPRLRCQPA